MTLSLKKCERLCSKKEIETLCREGRSVFVFPFRIIFKENGQQFNRILISVPKKNFKRAVRRNLLKRRIREAYRQCRDEVFGTETIKYDILFIYISKEIADYDVVSSKIRHILEKIGISGADRSGDIL